MMILFRIKQRIRRILHPQPSLFKDPDAWEAWFIQEVLNTLVTESERIHKAEKKIMEKGQ